jgi:hypothetical protein
MIYSIGNTDLYRDAIKTQERPVTLGPKITSDSFYPGGIAFQTIEKAWAWIASNPQTAAAMSVIELVGDWETNTYYNTERNYFCIDRDLPIKRIIY